MIEPFIKNIIPINNMVKKYSTINSSEMILKTYSYNDIGKQYKQFKE